MVPSPSRQTVTRVGPVPGKRNYWSACAVMAGSFRVVALANRLPNEIQGEPEADVYGMDVARYGPFAENKEYIKQTTGSSIRAGS